MLADELGQIILLRFGMDDTHPITTPFVSCCCSQDSGRVQRIRYSEALTVAM
jgi:hypothetical protein